MNECQRACPSCGKILTHANKYNAKYADRDGKLCLSCSLSIAHKKYWENNDEARAMRSERMTGEKNHWYGKKLSKEHVEKILKTRRENDSYAPCRTPEAREKNRLRNLGSNNAMYGKSVYSVWIEKYGQEIADKKMEECKAKHSQNSKGSNNPMFGKPSPKGSGNGWKGHYKDFYFRSLRELSFFVNYIERFNMTYDSLEKAKYKIKYTCPIGNERNYFGDFLINNKYFVEVKPKRLQSCPTNTAKFESAKIFCEENGFIFKLIDPKLNTDQIKELYLTGLIKFAPRYEEKFKSYIENPAKD